MNKPTSPPETIVIRDQKVFEETILLDNFNYKVEEYVKYVKNIYIDYDITIGDFEIGANYQGDILILFQKTIPNPNFEKEMEKYTVEIAKYNAWLVEE